MESNNNPAEPQTEPAIPAERPSDAVPNSAAAPKSAPAGQQIMDVVTPPARTAEEKAEVAAASPTEQPPQPAPAPAKPKTATSSDVKVAIIATVLIVIALAVLATMAFLKQK